MEDEMNAIHKNQTWELTTLLEEKKAIDLKWIYKTKFNPDGSKLKKKAKVITKGYTQQEGVDFTEVYSLVAQMETIHAFSIVRAQKNWCIFYLDIKITFLDGELSEEVYVNQP